VGVEASDILVVLSGGSTNSDPAASLGGSPSQQPVTTNLFSNITVDEAVIGKTDYRCVYVFNNNSTDYFDTTKIYVFSQEAGGADVELGVSYKTEVQKILVSSANTISSGSFDLKYTGVSDSTTVTVNWNASTSVWAINLRTALRTITGLEDVTVQVGTSNSGTVVIFTISFGGGADKRYHDILSTAANNLVGGSPNISITKIINGSPINAIDPEISSEIATPPEITFSTANALSPITIGKLGPLDGAPIWIKRTVEADAPPKIGDGFTLRVNGVPL
jgi:hypothetical protein